MVPFEQQDDDLKKKLAKNNEAKMVLYNALPKKEYERIFMCKTAKNIWQSLLITHQEESIDSGFARFNTIITSLKALDEGFSSKNYVRTFLRALHPNWREKVTVIEESKDLSSLALDELIGNLKVHVVVMEKDSEIHRGKKERVKSIALKVKKKSSDDETLTSRSDDEEYAMVVRNFKKFFRRKGCGDPNHLIGDYPKPSCNKDQKAFIRGSWSDSENDTEDKTNDETYLMAQSSNEVTLNSSHYSDDASSLDNDNNIEVSGSHVPEVFVSHYEQFLGTSMECNELNVEGLFSKSISATTSSNMVCDITNDEIKAAMFDISDDKAPSPDGKILSNRIIEGIKEVVSDNQAAFVPGRRISDNILITQELMHSYHRNRGPPRCAFKVDIQKAYDTVDWRFLETILVRFGFHCTMVKWIMACVTSTSFSLNINGNIHGFFKGKRGLRQGDPLSPYLFTMVMEILSLILKRRVRMSDSFRFHKHCEELEIINVCFADDLFIFARGDLASARVILESLDEFKMVSGLVPSIPKSTAYFCNVVHHVKLAILNIMPFSEGELPVKYLGIPLIYSRLLNKDCKILVEKLIRGFLWCNGEYKRGKAKVAWDDICLPKEEGGLGLRSLDVFNIALMTTHIWNIVSNKESLWVRWIHTYKLRGRSFWDIPFKDGMSWGWLKLLQLRDIVRPFFWVKLDISREGFSISTSVAELVTNGSWSWPQSWLLKAPDLGLIPDPVLDLSRADVRQWRDNNGSFSVFSVAKAWETLQPRGTQLNDHGQSQWKCLAQSLLLSHGQSRWTPFGQSRLSCSEKLMTRVTDISETLLILFYISVLKPNLQREFLVAKPATLGEVFALARVTEARLVDQQSGTITNTMATSITGQPKPATSRFSGPKTDVGKLPLLPTPTSVSSNIANKPLFIKWGGALGTPQQRAMF
ncbi:putative RNA-directed DNA polymerase [Tanacetum coccineum]|uniref:RNA-directed DNA polymerase n=1 Tax=Tanacetum coccineum TaxID=301880 RepID=A0ABQ4WM01_9ASTR